MSTSSSPAVDRVASILQYVGSRPNESYSVAELSRRLEMSKATCHALVRSLLEGRFLVRGTRDNEVSLGPAMISVALATVAPLQRLADRIETAMLSLTERTRAQGLALIAVGDEVVVLGTYGTPAPYQVSYHAGQRISAAHEGKTDPLPWSMLDSVELWRIPSTVGDDSSLEAVRSKGFLVLADVDRRVRPLSPQVVAGPSDERFHVVEISAPLYDEAGAAALTLALCGFSDPVSGAQISHIGCELAKIGVDAVG